MIGWDEPVVEDAFGMVSANAAGLPRRCEDWPSESESEPEYGERFEGHLMRCMLFFQW